MYRYDKCMQKGSSNIVCELGTQSFVIFGVGDNTAGSLIYLNVEHW